MSGKKRPRERYASHLLAEWYAGGKGASLDRISEETTISKPQVQSLIKRTKGFGPKVEDAVAAKWFGGSVDKFHKAADAWVEANPEAAVDDVFNRDPRADARNGFVAQALDDGHTREDITAALAHVDGSKSYKGENTYDAWFQAYREALRSLRSMRKGKSTSVFGIGARKP